MAAPISLSKRMRRKAPRLGKFARQWVRSLTRGVPESRLLFVVGSQRSGTRLPLQLLDASPDVISYSEGSAPFFKSVLLEPLERIEQLAARTPFPVIALKPICETHRVCELLERFPGSRAIWIFRNYRDAVSSASIKWQSGREAVRRLATGELDRAGWRAGGLTPAKLALVRELYDDALSLHAANAIMWYLRNDLFFDLGADRHPGILLLRYEALLNDPQPMLQRLFRFAEVSMPDGCRNLINGSSRSRSAFPPLPTRLEALCEQLERRLIDHFTRVNATPGRASGGGNAAPEQRGHHVG